MIQRFRQAFIAATVEHELPVIIAASLFVGGSVIGMIYMAGRLLGLFEW